ncbi:MAG: hypothetical protein HC900_11545 [Methylacidiphilales bacterium]|nr:hypothetical protein [Candidatus Methylacidiphilales bacterium]
MIYRAASTIPGSEDYREALKQPFVRGHHLLMLKAHAEAPDFTLSAMALSAAAGSADHRYANLHYGQLAHRIAEFLDIQPATYDEGKKRLWTTAIAEGWREVKNGIWYWRLYPEVATALI